MHLDCHRASVLLCRAHGYVAISTTWEVHHHYRRKQQYCRVCPSPWVGAAGPVYRHCRRGVVLPGCDRRPRRFGFGWQVSQRHMHACDCGSARVVFDARARASHTTAIMRLRPRLAPRTWSAASYQGREHGERRRYTQRSTQSCLVGRQGSGSLERRREGTSQSLIVIAPSRPAACFFSSPTLRRSITRSSRPQFSLQPRDTEPGT